MVNRVDHYTSTRKEEVFSDFNTSFVAHPNTAQLTRKTNVESVKQALRNLILTNKYERPRKPSFGGRIRNYLFEPLTPQTADAVREEIRMVVKNYEKRVNLIDVVVNAFPDDSALAVSLLFSISTSEEPVKLDLTLYRVR